MKIIKLIIILFISKAGLSQTKSMVYFNEDGEKVTRKKFFNKKNPKKNLDLYIKNDTTQIGILIHRQKSGLLDKKTLSHLKLYLTKISGKHIDTTQNIVINYLSAYPKKKGNSVALSTWNVLDKDFLERLHSIANINQFWINSPKTDNLEYFHNGKINWISDEEDLLKKMFFIYELRHGNYILIKPDGSFFCYLGEHSKYGIWKNAKKHFK